MRTKILILGLLLLLVGCSKIPSTSCMTKDCFISLANDCNPGSLTFTEEAGTFKYDSSANCVFTKTLVTANPNETQEMKTLLQGKSITCQYTKGKFDKNWVNTVAIGIEKCQGELRTILGRLLLFG